jgi:ferric-dicitrate binding protein FerR (iron transport regulator)
MYTIEELMMDESFVAWCLATGAGVPSRWKEIIRDNPGQASTFEEAKRLVLALHGGLGKMEVNRQIEIVRQQLIQQGDNSSSEDALERTPSLSPDFVVNQKGRIKRKLLRHMLPYSLMVITVLFLGWWVGAGRTGQESKSGKGHTASNFQSPLGQRQQVSLPDGSVVILNANSHIRLSPSFNNVKRELYLEGDAFFKVAHNTAKPFIVYAGNIATTALGTEFYVHGKSGVRVDLLEGKVQLNKIDKGLADQKVVLYPGESAELLVNAKLSKQSFDSLHLRSWLNGRLSFNETPIAIALKQLEEWYGTRIEVRGPVLQGRSLNGDYQDAPLQDILKVVCFALNSRYRFIENTVIIE